MDDLISRASSTDNDAQAGLITGWLESCSPQRRRELFVELVRMDCVLSEKLSAGYVGSESVRRLGVLLLFQFSRTTSLNIAELVMLMDEPVEQLNRALLLLLASAVQPDGNLHEKRAIAAR